MARHSSAWSREPGLLPRVPAGPERGKAWSDLSTDTLVGFMKERDPDVRFSAGTELNHRGEAPASAPAPLAQLKLI